MKMSNLELPKPPSEHADDYQIGAWVEDAIAGASNRQRLQFQLDSIASDNALLSFLHRFVLFNDALAARVPFLAGLIHLTPNLFLDPEPGLEFCRQANGRIAAFVAEAASDEYRMPEGRNMVHQFLSQRFFRGTLAYYGVEERSFDGLHPLPAVLNDLLEEARGKYFDRRGPEQIFAGLGFHVGLEFFAHQEFNLVDAYLRTKHPELVARLERDNSDSSSYVWLALHTVVEIGHYRAGLQALNGAVAFYPNRANKPLMVARIKDGFNAFVDLQRRFYEAILCDVD
jgi:hypothetical protein